MIDDGRALIATGWWISLFSGLAITITVLAFNSVGDWLRDRFDPHDRPGDGVALAHAPRPVEAGPHALLAGRVVRHRRIAVEARHHGVDRGIALAALTLRIVGAAVLVDVGVHVVAVGSGRTALAVEVAVEIDESLLQPSEKAMVEDLITAAINDARSKADAAAAPELQKMTSGIPLPPGFKLPF